MTFRPAEDQVVDRQWQGSVAWASVRECPLSAGRSGDSPGREPFHSPRSIRSVRVTFDPKKNRAYICLREFDEGEDSRQYDVGGPQMLGSFTLDFDRAGRLIGIEVFSAREALPEGFLDDAEAYSASD